MRFEGRPSGVPQPARPCQILSVLASLAKSLGIEAINVGPIQQPETRDGVRSTSIARLSKAGCSGGFQLLGMDVFGWNSNCSQRRSDLLRSRQW